MQHRSYPANHKEGFRAVILQEIEMVEMTKKDSSKNRRDHEPPAVIEKYGWRFHHMGIPTDTPRPGEQYLEKFKMYVSGFQTSPYGIEWMRFEQDSPVSELVKTFPHLAFEVDDLEVALKGKKLIGEISSPSEGVRVAMIIDNDAPVELLEFSKDSCR
jgi:hypothetical protein